MEIDVKGVQVLLGNDSKRAIRESAHQEKHSVFVFVDQMKLSLWVEFVSKKPTELDDGLGIELSTPSHRVEFLRALKPKRPRPNIQKNMKKDKIGYT